LIKELEPRVKSLRRQAKRMEARETIEQELKLYLKEFLGSNYWQLKEQSSNLQEQVTKLQKQRSEIEQGINDHLKKIEQHEQANAENLSKFQAEQGELQSLQAQKNGLLENLSLIRGKMQSQRTAGGQDQASLQVAQHTLEQRISELKQRLAATAEEISRAQGQGEQRAQALQELNKQFDAVYEALQRPINADWASLRAKLIDVEQVFDAFYQFLTGTEDIAAVRAEANRLREKWQQFSQVIYDASGSTQINPVQLQTELQGLSKQKDALTEEINNLNVAASKALMSRDFLQQQITKAEQELLQVSLDLKKAESSSSDDFVEQMLKEESGVQEQIETLQKQIAEKEQKLQKYYDEENQGKSSLAEEDKAFRQLQSQLNQIRDQESGLQVEKAKYDTQLETVITEIHQSLGPEVGGQIQQQKIKAQTPQLEEKIGKLRHQLELIGGVDELTLQEYHETEARYTNLSNQVTDLKKSMGDLRAVMDELDQHIKVKFNEAFHKVNAQFENYFRVLFNGGRAYLSLIRSGEEEAETPEAEEEREEAVDQQQLRPEEKLLAKYEKGGLHVTGVDIKATPPNKKLATIQALSGGERALTSIALLCSLLTCFPSPFVVLDEVDAALDEANTIRFGQILGTLAHQTQFITITHNRETMAQSNTLYGVTMGDDGISKLLSIKLEQARVYAK
jgi:chromosome segregation protein